MNLIKPRWPAPAHVHAVVTTRQGGVSRAPYDSFNLGDLVKDSAESVIANRKRLSEYLALPSGPNWLSQVHGTKVVTLHSDTATGIEADASVTATKGIVCAVLTADCLPVLFTDRDGNRIAAAHAGWRGLAAGILEATLAKMESDPERVLVWMGPAIGSRAFEVGPEVREKFISQHPASASAFRPSIGDRWWMDIYELARQRLRRQGVEAIFGGGFCTYSDPEQFFSYRRDGETGRMTSLIWTD